MKNHFLLFLFFLPVIFINCSKPEPIPEIEWKIDELTDEAAYPIRHVFDVEGDYEYFTKEAVGGEIVRFMFGYGSLSEIVVESPVEKGDSVRNVLWISYTEGLGIKTIEKSEISLKDYSRKEYVLFFNDLHCLLGYDYLVDRTSQQKFTFELFDFASAFRYVNENEDTYFKTEYSNAIAWLKKEETNSGELSILFADDSYGEDIQFIDEKTGMRGWEFVLRVPGYFEVRFNDVSNTTSAGWMHEFEKEYEKAGKWDCFNQWFLLDQIEFWEKGELVKSISLG